MNIGGVRTIGELAARYPQALPILDEWGVDYYCRGTRDVAEACAAVGINEEKVKASFRCFTGESKADCWLDRPLSELTNFIVRTSHTRLWSELARLAGAIKCVEHETPQVLLIERVRALSMALCSTLVIHLRSEESLFAAIETLERVSRTGNSCVVGTLSNRILVEYHEHDLISERLRTLREITTNFYVAPDWPIGSRTLMEEVGAIEQEMRELFHLENNVLLPRAGELEREVRMRLRAR